MPGQQRRPRQVEPLSASVAIRGPQLAAVRRNLLAVLLVTVLVGDVEAQQPPASQRPLVVFAASSLRAALDEAGVAFAQRAPAVRVQLHVAGSTALRHQITAGAPADVFVSADLVDVQALRAHGIAVEPQLFATNRLVIAAPANAASLQAASDLLDASVQRVAVGNPRSAPVGRYTQHVLGALAMRERIEARLVPCENARQITSAVARGACDFGIAYRTDVIAEPRLRVVFTLDASLHAPIGYYVTTLPGARHKDDAATWTRFVHSDTVGAILQRHGFIPEARVAISQAAADAALQHRAPQRLARQGQLQPLWLSLRVASLATLCSGAAGLALGAFLARRRRGLRRDLLAALTDLPLVMPPTVVGLVLLELCAPRAPLGAVVERLTGARLTFTWVAAVLASAVMALPLMVRTARAALESVPMRYLDAARTLGASPWSAFWRVQLPLAQRGVVAGLVLCFFRALGEFGATLMVAGNIPGRTQTLPLAIYSAVFEGRPHDAALWVAWVLVLSGGGAVVAQRLSRSAAP